MVSKTPSKKVAKYRETAFTLLEVILVTGVILVLIAGSLSLISPAASKAKSRDAKRMSDISTLDRAINEYRIDYGIYPGQENVTYKSNEIPVGSSNIYQSTHGWIPTDLSDYISKYPTDPLNDSTYYYEYRNNTSGYELSARVEVLTEEASADGGNDPAKYEIGLDLTLITP